MFGPPIEPTRSTPPGPTTKEGKSHSSHNAVRHGILARKVEFETDEQREEYQALWQSWRKDYCPVGRLEKFLVEEITSTSWKLGITEGLETRELLRRQNYSSGIDGIFHGHLDLPVSSMDLPLDREWDCERVVVRAVAGSDSRDVNASRYPIVYQNQVLNGTQSSRSDQSQKVGHLEIQAVMGSSLDTMTRYRSALKRDFYRAIETLRAVQAERHEREKGSNGHV